MTDQVNEDYKTLPFTNKAEYLTPPLQGNPTDEEVAKAEVVLKQREDSFLQQKTETRLVCKCGHLQKVCESTHVQTMWYTRPRGCNEGDYWNHGEVQVPCNECGVRMRLAFKCEEIQKNYPASLFKETLVFYN